MGRQSYFIDPKIFNRKRSYNLFDKSNERKQLFFILRIANNKNIEPLFEPA